jgi:hypothetical protein
MNRNHKIIEEPKPAGLPPMCQRGDILPHRKQEALPTMERVRVREPVPFPAPMTLPLRSPVVLVMSIAPPEALGHCFRKKIGSLRPFDPVTVIGEANRRVTERMSVARGLTRTGHRKGIGDGILLWAVHDALPSSHFRRS